ncbi:MAG: arginyltransferase [Hyphomicrobiaceae bacterium]|nr:arginyltransferase [Hyphomicrobiaceae bacterium]
MSEQQKFPEFYVTAPQPCPYLPHRFERKLFTHLTSEKPLAHIDNLLRSGFRRSQNIAYVPYCDSCQACVSIRVAVAEFQPSRSMRRIVERNTGLRARRIEPVPTSEQYGLFRRYIDSRHSDGGMADMSVLDYAMMIEDSVIDTFLTEYRARPAGPAVGSPKERTDGWPLKAVSLCDKLSDGVSMVYSFYDTTDEALSLGTYMIIEHIAYAKSLGLPYLYLGYWIAGSRKMNYKSRFGPQEHLGADGWYRARSQPGE